MRGEERGENDTHQALHMCDCLPPSLLLYEMGTNGYPYPRVTDEAAEAPGGRVKCSPAVTSRSSAGLPSQTSQAPKHPQTSSFSVCLEAGMSSLAASFQSAISSPSMRAQ